MEINIEKELILLTNRIKEVFILTFTTVCITVKISGKKFLVIGKW
jgi:hypothetical protein